MIASGRASLASSGRISGSGLASARISGRSAIFLDHLRLEHAGGRQPQENVGAGDDFAQRARRGLPGVARLVGVHLLDAAGVDHALDVGDRDVLHLHPEADQQVQAGQRRGARARDRQLGTADVLAHDLQPVQHGGGNDDGRAVLVIVKHRNLHPLAELALDVKTFGRLDVLEVDAAEGGFQPRDGVDQLDRGRSRRSRYRRHRCRRTS